ncbi:hypothetical protein DFH06DRAFT_1169475 [Mycena polygramma]|nr:hypothetical protein DFH06DRAFT_1169475 [Mycena polygramma]
MCASDTVVPASQDRIAIFESPCGRTRCTHVFKYEGIAPLTEIPAILQSHLLECPGRDSSATRGNSEWQSPKGLKRLFGMQEDIPVGYSYWRLVPRASRDGSKLPTLRGGIHDHPKPERKVALIEADAVTPPPPSSNPSVAAGILVRPPLHPVQVKGAMGPTFAPPQVHGVGLKAGGTPADVKGIDASKQPHALPNALPIGLPPKLQQIAVTKGADLSPAPKPNFSATGAINPTPRGKPAPPKSVYKKRVDPLSVRRAALNGDEWTLRVTPKDVLCRGCGRTVALGKPHQPAEYRVGRWVTHRSRCAGVKKERSLTIAKARQLKASMKHWGPEPSYKPTTLWARHCPSKESWV